MKRNQAVPEGLKALGDRKTAIVPTEQRLLIESGQNTAAKKDDDDDDDDDNATATTAACDKEVEFKHIPSALRVGRSRSSVAQAHSIHEEHEKHERILAELQMRRQKRCTLRTQQRVLARSMLRDCDRGDHRGDGVVQAQEGRRGGVPGRPCGQILCFD